VSQTIRALEREVGAALFERTSRSVRLTALGERFRSGAQRGYDELNRTLAEARAAARDITGELSVGYLPSIGGGLLATVAAAFEQHHPQCRSSSALWSMSVRRLSAGPRGRPSTWALS